MRFQSLVTSFVLPLAALGAKAKAPSSTFDKYHSKSLSSAPVILAEKSFNELVSLPRDYGVVACLTALGPQFGCKICQDFKPEWEVLAQSWTKGDKEGESRLVFGTLDFTDGRQVFQSLKLETAPVLFYYPPTTGPNAHASSSPIRYDFSSGAPQAEQIHTWLSRNLPDTTVKPPINRPFNWMRLAIFTTIGLGGITAIATAYPYLMPVIQNRNIWAVGSIVAILLFTSGHMYNHIRGTPYVSGNGKGGVQYFAPGFQNQYGMESQIIAAIYAVLAFSTIFLALKVPRIQDPKTQQACVFIWGGVMYGVYGYLMSIFRLKNQNYPYGLPPF